jgi:ABC-type branched-subunit amino acid transport system ATPase component
MGLALLLMQELFKVLKELNETGNIVMEGSAEDLSLNEEIQKAYLG